MGIHRQVEPAGSVSPLLLVIFIVTWDDFGAEGRHAAPMGEAEAMQRLEMKSGRLTLFSDVGRFKNLL